MQSRRLSGLPLIGILAVIYFIAGKLGLMLASLHASASPVWPPAGIALAGLLLLGYRAWPAIFIGAFLVNFTSAGNVATAFAIATGNTLEALVGAWLVNRFAGGTNVFDRPQGVFKFALAAGISTIISPAFGVTSLGVAGFADWAKYGAIWLTWWLGDVTGDLVFTPLVLLWSVASKRRWNKKEAAEVGALLLLLVLLSGVVFGGWPGVSARNYPIVLICGPIVIWTAFRFTQRETATGIFILSAIAVWGTLHGFGPFVGETENQSLLAVQWWTAVLSITAMALSATMAERRRVEEELQQQKVVVKSANGTKDQFLAMLSHELRTPLTPVISALESLETEPAQTDGDRSVEPKSDLEPEIAHLLSIDVAGYSKLWNNEQIELLQDLNQIVRSTECFRSAEASGKLKRVPTGDGMALLFFRSPEEPVRCALEISGALRDHPHIRLRMGVHSGPVNRITDVNDKTNFAGSGINVAQRVLDCGDAGHILLSAHVADDLARWQPYLHDLGECEVKHGLRLHLFNLYKDGLGNPQVPGKLRRRRRGKQESDMVRPVSLPGRPRSLLVITFVVAALAMVISSLTFFQRISLRMTPSTLIPEKSIAVLPFENLSNEKENAYFADGVQDEILTGLSRVADLKVISRTSVIQYKAGLQHNLREVAADLGVAHVLEGTVQRVGSRVRVNAQLIDARTDSQLWAERYDRDVADMFAIESELAGKIVAQLQAQISPIEKAAIKRPSTTDLAAYDLYLRAQDLFADTSDPIHAREKLPQAAQLLDEAVARDPDFIQAWSLLSRVHGAAYFRGHDHTPARLGLANAAVQTALRLQPDAGEAHLALAIYYYDGFRDYGRARSELVIARRALPNSAEVFRYTGMIDRREGHWDEATRNLERALELDRRNFFTLQQLAYAYRWQHRYADEVRTYDRALAIMPGDPGSRINLALVALDWRADIKPFQATLATLVAENPGLPLDLDALRPALCERPATAAIRALTNYPREGVVNNGVNNPRAYWDGVIARCQGDSAKAQAAFTAARREIEKTVERQPDFAAALSLLGMIDAGLERKEQAIQEGRRACELLPISKDAIDGVDIAINLAQIYAWTGEKDRAIEQIAAVERVPNSLSYGLLKLHPYWDPLRGDPRFEKIVASLAPKL
ncbi:MAG TPA: MASE1 domain-containing protein [Candidatus Dormibacteraeota bacterium]|nr:MASE1 domain-containing protein [Candidatus Dormibacteraeota bacterium]